jgi:hypothetical protein
MFCTIAKLCFYDEMIFLNVQCYYQRPSTARAQTCQYLESRQTILGNLRYNIPSMEIIRRCMQTFPSFCATSTCRRNGRLMLSSAYTGIYLNSKGSALLHHPRVRPFSTSHACTQVRALAHILPRFGCPKLRTALPVSHRTGHRRDAQYGDLLLNLTA